MAKEEQCFWLGQDIRSVKAVEKVSLPPDILMEDIGQWLSSGSVPLVVQGGPALLPFGEVWMEIEASGAMPA